MPYSGGTPRHVRESCCPGLHTVTTSSPDRLHLGPVICRWLLRRGGRERVRPPRIRSPSDDLRRVVPRVVCFVVRISAHGWRLGLASPRTGSVRGCSGR